MARKRVRRDHRGDEAANDKAVHAAASSVGANNQSKDKVVGTDGNGTIDMDLALRAVKWLRPRALGSTSEDVDESLLCALRPLIMVRAVQYEESQRLSKVHAAIGKITIGTAPSSNASGSKRARDAAGDLLNNSDDEDGDPLDEAEIPAAAKVLRALALRPEALVGKECKPLRVALHPLVDNHVRMSRASPTFRVTCLLGDRGRWPEVLPLLREMRALEPSRRPRLGALQRWIRELNVADADSNELALLDAIMRVAAGFTSPSGPSPVDGKIEWFPPWEPVLAAAEPKVEVAAGPSPALVAAEPKVEVAAAPSPALEAAEPTVEVTAAPSQPVEVITGNATDAKEEDREVRQPSMVNKCLAMIQERKNDMQAQKDSVAAAGAAAAALVPASFPVIAHEAAHERTPPNRFDLDIYTCPASHFSFSQGAPSRPVANHPMPGVNGAFVLSDVLSRGECDALRIASEGIGYRPDVPLSSALDERAQNVVLLASELQDAILFERVKRLLPQKIGRKTLVGLNRRWRLYRYHAGNLYRKHLDGAWPGSGTTVDTKGKTEYVYDAMGENTRSLFTFIVYLNEDFEGGGTTFYLPKADSEGVMEGRPVKPRIGSATVFPHGSSDTALHEGSKVESGTKYLLRTEVLYAAPESPESMKELARKRGLVRQLGLVKEVTSAGPKKGGAASDDIADGNEEGGRGGATKTARGVRKKLKHGPEDFKKGAKDENQGKKAGGEHKFAKKNHKKTGGKRANVIKKSKK